MEIQVELEEIYDDEIQVIVTVTGVGQHNPGPIDATVSNIYKILSEF